MYELIEIPGKGRGIVATKAIPKNTIILKEAPILLVEDVYDALYQLYYSEDGQYDDIQESLIEQFESLTPDCLDKYIITTEDIVTDLKTLPKYIQEFFENYDPYKLRLHLAKFYRNAFRYADLKSSSSSSIPSAVLIKGALFNHSCCNNCEFRISESTNDYIFTTNRDIAPGEELCITYLDTNLSTKKRSTQLESQYGFICTCQKCLH
jgi:hypothetical protein